MSKAHSGSAIAVTGLRKAFGDDAAIALAWCAGIALAGYLWSRRLFNRES